MKNGLTYIILGGVIVWNVLLSLPKDEINDSINYQLLQELHHENERRFQKYELQVKSLKDEIRNDSVIVYTATRSERDSLRSIYNPR